MNQTQPIHSIVDDHPVVRQGLQVAGGASDLDRRGSGGWRNLPFLSKPWLMLFCWISDEKAKRIEVARRPCLSSGKIIVLTTYDDESLLPKPWKLACMGICSKVFRETLPDSIRAVMQGEKLLNLNWLAIVEQYQKLAQSQAQTRGHA
jgi:DNA-binding NarL/FixJ family response regulator